MPVRVETLVVEGRVRQHFIQDPPDPSKPLLLTGPVQGTFTLADGTAYDVSPEVVEVGSQDHAGELSHLIGLRHERDGHPTATSRFSPDYNPMRDEFHHVCTGVCGGNARTAEEHVAEFNERLRRLGYGDRIDEPVDDTDVEDNYPQRVAKLTAAYARHAEEG